MEIHYDDNVRLMTDVKKTISALWKLHEDEGEAQGLFKCRLAARIKKNNNLCYVLKF